MTPRTYRPLILGSLLLAFSLRPTAAQNAGAPGQVDTLQQQRSLAQSAQQQYQQGDNAPEIYPGESDDVGPQSVLAIKPRRQWVEATLDSQYFYTDNMFLDPANRQETGVMVSTVQVALAPTAYELFGGMAAPRIGYRHQWFDFFQYSTPKFFLPNLNSFDFNSQTIFTDERWMRDNWTVGVGFDYTRLMTTSSYEQFYSEYVPRWEVQRVFPVCPKSAFSLAYQGYYHFTDAPKFAQPQSDFFNRLDQVFQASFNFMPCSHVVVEPYYRFKYTHFNETTDRDDYLHSVGVGLYCFFTQQISARIYVNYDKRNSTLALAEYHQLDAGGGLNFSVKF